MRETRSKHRADSKPSFDFKTAFKSVQKPEPKKHKKLLLHKEIGDPLITIKENKKLRNKDMFAQDVVNGLMFEEISKKIRGLSQDNKSYFK